MDSTGLRFKARSALEDSALENFDGPTLAVLWAAAPCLSIKVPYRQTCLGVPSIVCHNAVSQSLLYIIASRLLSFVYPLRLHRWFRSVENNRPCGVTTWLE